MSGRVYLSPIPDRGLVSALLKDPTSHKVDPLLNAAMDMIRTHGGRATGLVTVDGLTVAPRFLYLVLRELGARGMIEQSVVHLAGARA